MLGYVYDFLVDKIACMYSGLGACWMEPSKVNKAEPNAAFWVYLFN